jgi:hypothetical protein
MTHLFFDECSNAKVVWGNLGEILGTSLCPSSLWQSVARFYQFYPRGRRFHMLLLAAICWGIWKVRNKITFEKVVVCSPLVTIAMICSLLHYWEGLFGCEDGGRIKRGADQMLQRAFVLHSNAPPAMAPGTSTTRQGMLMITNGGD